MLRDRIPHGVLREARLRHVISAAQVNVRALGFLDRGIFVGTAKYVFTLVTMSFYWAQTMSAIIPASATTVACVPLCAR